MGWKFARVRSGRDARGCPRYLRVNCKVPIYFGSVYVQESALKFIWLQSNRRSSSSDLLANLTNLALMPNFLHIFHPRKRFNGDMPHATVDL